MGNINIKSINFKSNCTITHELNDDIKNNNYCLNSLELKQSDIILLNKIISKRKKITVG